MSTSVTSRSVTMVKGELTLIPIVATFAASLFPTSTVMAHGVAEQINDPSSSVSFWCAAGLYGSLYQGFTPTAPSIVAVDLHLRVREDLPQGFGSNVRIRSASPSGTSLGVATTTVPGAFSAGDDVLVHFDFDSALSLTPGSPYVIEWPAFRTSVYPEPEWILSWVGTFSDIYAGGHFFGCNGNPDPGADLNFVTFMPAAPPLATDDTASTSLGTAVVIDVAANDTDPDSDLDPTTVSIASAASNGVAVSNGDGTVTYTPDTGFIGIDTFTYEICDAEGLCDEAEVTIEVVGRGVDPPSDPGDVVPDTPANANDDANPNACEDNPGRADEHRPDNTPPCRGG